MYSSCLAVIFAGINTNLASFEHPGKEIELKLSQSFPEIQVSTLTIYPYDDSVSGDTFSDSLQVIKNAYALCGNTVKSMAQQITDKFSDGDFVFFTGYSGGGIAATVTAEYICKKKLFPISKIIRVGSPLLTVGKSFYGKTVDIILPDDPVCQLEIPRFFKNFRPHKCFVKNLVLTKNVHSCYFSEKLTDSNGVSNLSKTVETILKFAKN